MDAGNKKMKMDIDSVVGTLVKDFLQKPDYSPLMEEIATHEEDFCNLTFEGETEPKLYKVLFTTDDTIIVQELELTWNRTRFEVRKIHAPTGRTHSNGG